VTLQHARVLRLMGICVSEDGLEPIAYGRALSAYLTLDAKA